MNFFQLFLLGLEVVSDLVVNPVFGVGEDGQKASVLIGTLAAIGRKGEEALPELIEFTDQVKALRDTNAPVSDSPIWDAITARRKAQHQAIADLGSTPEG